VIKPDLKARVLRAAEIYRKHGVTQDEIAEVVGASQPQVSRVLKGDGLRTTKLLEEICLYAERFEGGVTSDAVQSNKDLVEALRMTWDGSAEHARALAVVIRSLAVLRPIR
jgi:transcriptional regulator with XRE-family HTH domain